MIDRKEEIKENNVYKKYIEDNLVNNKDLYCKFQYEKQMAYIIECLNKDINTGSKTILDVCCGYGRLIYFLNEKFPSVNITGIDYIPELIKQGEELFENNKNINMYVANVYELSNFFNNKLFDISISYKTLSWMPYYENKMKELFKITKKKIYITSLFYDGDIDFLNKIYCNASNNEKLFSHLNTYSFPKFKKFCMDHGAKNVIQRSMNIDFDIEIPTSPNILSTYTQRIDNGKRLEITGNNILYWKLIEVQLN